MSFTQSSLRETRRSALQVTVSTSSQLATSYKLLQFVWQVVGSSSAHPRESNQWTRLLSRRERLADASAADPRSSRDARSNEHSGPEHIKRVVPEDRRV